MSGSPASITVEKIVPLSNGGSLKAFASVRLGGILVHDFRIIQQEGKTPWVSCPQKEVSKDGQRKWFPIVELNDSLKAAVSEKVLQAWREATNA